MLRATFRREHCSNMREQSCTYSMTVEHQLELSWLEEGEVSRVGPFEYLLHLVRGMAR